MNTIIEITKDRGNQIRNTKALNESLIASLDKMEQVMLNLSETLTNLSKRYEIVMKPHESERILNNITAAK